MLMSHHKILNLSFWSSVIFQTWFSTWTLILKFSDCASHCQIDFSSYWKIRFDPMSQLPLLSATADHFLYQKNFITKKYRKNNKKKIKNKNKNKKETSKPRNWENGTIFRFWFENNARRWLIFRICFWKLGPSFRKLCSIEGLLTLFLWTVCIRLFHFYLNLMFFHILGNFKVFSFSESWFIILGILHWKSLWAWFAWLRSVSSRPWNIDISKDDGSDSLLTIHLLVQLLLRSTRRWIACRWLPLVPICPIPILCQLTSLQKIWIWTIRKLYTFNNVSTIPRNIIYAFSKCISDSIFSDLRWSSKCVSYWCKIMIPGPEVNVSL